MPTLTLTVGASTDDTNSQSITNTGKGPATANVVAGDLTSTTLSPGGHTIPNDVWSMGARFTNVTVPQGATINSAAFSLKVKSPYEAVGKTIRYWVSAHAVDNAATFNTTTGDLDAANRPRSTADATWTQSNTTVGGPRFSVTITSVIQEIVNRPGWASGQAITIIVDTHADTTSGEWQDYYAWDDATDRTNNPPQLSITFNEGGGEPAPPQSRYVGI